MIAPVLDHHLEITPGVCGGKPRVISHRITVQDIAVWHERLGKSADDICTEHDLSLADVYAALAYYFDHRAEIDADIAQSEAFLAAVRAGHSSNLQKKLMAIRGE